MTEELHPGYNTGVKVRPPSPKDYIAGNSPFDNMPDRVKDWSPYRTPNKRQSLPGVYDTNGCTNFGYLCTVGSQINLSIADKTIDPLFYAFLLTNGYLLDGNFNASEAALATMSGLQPDGNYLNNVAEAARKGGLIPESKFTSDPSLFTSQADWLRPVPQDLLALGQKFLQFVQLGYHQLDGGQPLAQGVVKKAPLYIALCTCNGWSTDIPVKWCGITQTNHCVSLYADIDPNPPVVTDSYPTFLKELALDYQIPVLFQVFVIPKKVNIMFEKVVKKDGVTFGVRIATPNGDQIIYATGEPQWVSWSKPDSYAISTVKADGTPDFTGCTQLPW